LLRFGWSGLSDSEAGRTSSLLATNDRPTVAGSQDNQNASCAGLVLERQLSVPVPPAMRTDWFLLNDNVWESPR
jgi:hypothetical protein